MKRATLDLLYCPSCRLPYACTAHDEADGEIATGFLLCPGCAILVPIVRGFALFTEPLLHQGLASPGALADLDARCFGTDADYAAYARQKRARGSMEIYAAFQPFNESTRAAEPLLGRFRQSLKPGDYILDPWCRTGWSAHWLAALFPEQTIVALWEGDRSVLGYRGYAHWFSPARRPANIEVMFVHPERGLPFASGSFGGVYALDAFHRFSPAPFAGEILRVAADRATILLAHLHLSNGEPDPWFDRGGTHWHGRDYQAWIDRLAATGNRTGAVYSEADLFETPPGSVPAPDPDTSHYNGFVVIHPREAMSTPAAPIEECRADDRLLVNPLFAIHPALGVVRVEAGLHDGAAGTLLDRHPLYRARLPEGAVSLDLGQLAILALAIAGVPCGEIAAALGCDAARLDAMLAPLEAMEVLRRTPVPCAGVDLQRFHANQIGVATGDDPLAVLIEELAGATHVALRTSDGGEIGADDLHAAIGSLSAWLTGRGLETGATLSIRDTGDLLVLPLILAGLAIGLEVRLGAATDTAPALIVGMDPDASPYPDMIEGAEAGLHIRPGGRLVFASGVGFDATTLATASLSLVPFCPPPREALADLAALPELLACLVALAGKQSVMLRVTG